MLYNIPRNLNFGGDITLSMLEGQHRHTSRERPCGCSRDVL